MRPEHFIQSIPTIFLDIDGVLNTVRSQASWSMEQRRVNGIVLDQQAVENFACFLARLQKFQLILSSTWRRDEIFGLQETNMILEKYNLPACTDRTNPLQPRKAAATMEYIQQYKPEYYLVIDDDTPDFPLAITSPHSLWLKKGWVCGFSKCHIEHGLKKLKLQGYVR